MDDQVKRAAIGLLGLAACGHAAAAPPPTPATLRRSAWTCRDGWRSFAFGDGLGDGFGYSLSAEAEASAMAGHAGVHGTVHGAAGPRVSAHWPLLGFETHADMDAAGRFAFTDLAEGPLDISVFRADGCSAELRVMLQAGSNIDIDWRIE